jgi:hypothetical protein
MKRLLSVIALLAPLAVLAAQSAAFQDSRLAVIDDPLRVEFQAGAGEPTKEKMRQVIAIVASSRDWKTLSESDGRFELTRTVSGKHTMRVELTYGEAGYDIRYLDSVNLLYREQQKSVTGRSLRAIHKNYNVWVRELASAINAGLGLSATIHATEPPLTPLPKNVKVVAPAPDVPAAIAAYSGVWGGTWDGRQGLAHTVVVERIEGRTVSFIYSFDPAQSENATGRGWRRVKGTIGDDGVLRAILEGGAGIANLSYKLSADGSKLLGERSRNGRVAKGSFVRRNLPAAVASDTKS